MGLKDGGLRLATGEIPDTGLLHDYDASSLDLADGDTVSTFVDQTGNSDLSSNGAPIYRPSGINDRPAVEYDGVDDIHIGSVNSFGEEIVAFIVYQLDDGSNRQIALAGQPDGLFLEINNGSGSYQINADGDSSLSGGAPSKGPNIFTADWTTAEIRINGSSVVTASRSYNATNSEIQLGGFDGLDTYVDGVIARVLIYDESAMYSGQIQDVEEVLNGTYAIY